ncbi:MAG: [FeFe] hydrogenase H-cluster maturation GTPase HydF [Elusimicrobiaceae bacterium]|nr:[FeFe] hydrogenase H-cluster maturation GTPase HydF [Elusimicrobiaceae bacterium]
MVQVNKPHIGVFGRTNVGKSSLINALTGQSTAMVSEHPGTTTDPVKKTMEILGIGPVVFIDTAGINDSSDLGMLRIQRTHEALDHVDLAILVFADQFDAYDQSLMESCVARKIPFFFVHNKEDISPLNVDIRGADMVKFSCKKPNIPLILDKIKAFLPKSSYSQDVLLDDYVRAGDEVVLVIPIDDSAPQGRLILPQVQTLRNLLDIGATAICVRDTELREYLQNHTPKLVITDSQVFEYVSSVVPESIPLTSFSILFSRLKGDFEANLKGTRAISRLQDGDRILIMESCSHSVNKCDDIGRTKLPNWLRKFTGKKLQFHVVASLDALPADVENYKLAIQCGGCMVTRTQILRRLEILKEKGVAISNYGLAIAYCNGIFDRATQLFKKK